jgi:micrococcal nuclease
VKRIAALALLIFLLNAPTAAMTGRASYISDGDTLWVRPSDGGKPIKLRLHGLDAPEVCQAGGVASRDALKRLVDQRSLQVETFGRDAWGRTIARISIDRRDLGARMVQDGHAWSDRFRDDPGPYATEETSARRARRGVFAQAKPERPRDFRLRHGPCEAPTGVTSH